MKRIIYDEQVEKELDNYMKIIYQNNLELHAQAVLDLLLATYDKTKYPGVYYRIALLYEFGYFKRLNEDKSIEYYKKAAELNYVAAMNRLAEIGLEDFKRYGFKYANYSLLSSELEDSYGTYLFAKYLILDGSLAYSTKNNFKDGLQMMKKSADLGCQEAKQYLEMMERL